MMLFRDKISVVTRVKTGEDKYGVPVYEETTVDHRAEVRPISSEENTAGAQQVITRYRLFVGPRVELDPTSAITWRGAEYEIAGGIEPHTQGGRLHHFEAIMERVTG